MTLKLNSPKILFAMLAASVIPFAFAQTDTVSLSATAPAPAITMSFVGPTGTDVTALSFGALTAGVKKSADSAVVMKQVYTNVGTTSDNLSVAYSTTLPTGYTLEYATKTGTAAATADVAYTSAFAGNLASGEGTVFMIQGGTATATVADATNITFKVTAATNASENLAATLTATLTAN
jgi:hypothetical protein